MRILLEFKHKLENGKNMINKQTNSPGFESQNSLHRLASSLVLDSRKLLHTAKTEEDLRVGFEKLLEPVLKELGIEVNPRYEKSIFNSGRSDALHGQVVIEYESPGSFKSLRSINHAFDQLVGYLQGLSKSQKATLFIFESKFIGVGFDGYKIFFVRYKGEKKLAKTELNKGDFILIGPYDFNEQSTVTLLTHLRALARLPLTAENLVQKFGPQSELAPKVVGALANALEYWGGQTHIRTFFNEWKRLFGIVYGEPFNGQQNKGARSLAKIYKIGEQTDFQELLFSVHTYFAFLMKLIAAEILTLKETSLSSSLASELAHVADNELKSKLDDIENGGVYTRKGITNFLEGDFFRWYLDTLDSPELKDAIREIARALSEFEPATSTIDPASTRDLLKKLYQYLVPQDVRHSLGEYYTPDWLAELLLNEVGYDGNTQRRLLDPACGSGTFLVLAIHRAKEHGRKANLTPIEIAERIIANIWGFDLNPLAVIAARTNYLFALGDLANELSNLEIPIYLTDSVLWPEQVGGQGELNFHGGEYAKIKTSVREFHVPSIWIKDKGFLMKEAAPMVERFVKNGFEAKIALRHLKKEGLVFPPNEQIVENFYEEILELEKHSKNGIWARFLKNAFGPMVAGKFDFVVGNPPWIRWGYLSSEYRRATLQMWKDYGLFSLKGHAARLGGGEKDFSMLFTYASADYYLKNKAKLGFLITQEVFKSKGAGEGFRRFRLGEKGEWIRVLKAHDLVTVQPFEGATNKTAAIILKKGEKSEYPVPYIIWTRKKGIGKIATDKLLEEVSPLLQKKKMTAQPLGSQTGSWQTFSMGEEKISSIEGKNFYQARQGADPQPYGVFLLEVKGKLSDGDLLIGNLSQSGKFKVPLVEEKIEPDLVYPALRGSDVHRWIVTPKIFILMAQDPLGREPYPESKVKSSWPKVFNYLTKFRDILLSRRSKSIRDLMNRTAFYAMFGIGPYTISPYKVVWKFMSNDIYAAVISQHKTIFGYKTIIPTKTVAMFAANNESEAHYLCAIINSKPVRDFIKSFSSAGRGFGTPSVMEHVGIPRCNSKNQVHQKLAEASKTCHLLGKEGREGEINKIEKTINELVIQLFNDKHQN
jgi:type I restriction-modification system DNA methylase subunit